jgi:acyl carrier protein
MPAIYQLWRNSVNTLEKLNPIFRQVFEDDEIVVKRETTADDIDAWDSLSHINLVLAIEMEFKIRFALGELQSLKNVGHLVDLIEKKLASK